MPGFHLPAASVAPISTQTRSRRSTGAAAMTPELGLPDIWRWQCKGEGCRAQFNAECVLGGATCPYCGSTGRRIFSFGPIQHGWCPLCNVPLYGLYCCCEPPAPLGPA
jgi:hypothetical protein